MIMADEKIDAPQTALVLIDLQVRIVGRQLAPRGGAEVVRQCSTDDLVSQLT